MNTADRIIQLEEKIIFQEDTLLKLDEVITKQYSIIDKLSFRIKQLEEQMGDLKASMDKQPGEMMDERPPHY